MRRSWWYFYHTAWSKAYSMQAKRASLNSLKRSSIRKYYPSFFCKNISAEHNLFDRSKQRLCLKRTRSSGKNQSHSQSCFTTGDLLPIISGWWQAPWDSRPVILFFNSTLAVWRGVQIMKLLVMQFPPMSRHFIPRRSKYSLQYPVLKHPQYIFLP
jgi:hypothetical protein